MTTTLQLYTSPPPSMTRPHIATTRPSEWDHSYMIRRWGGARLGDGAAKHGDVRMVLAPPSPQTAPLTENPWSFQRLKEGTPGFGLSIGTDIRRHDLFGTARRTAGKRPGVVNGGSGWGGSPSWQSQTGRVWGKTPWEVAPPGTAQVFGLMKHAPSYLHSLELTWLRGWPGPDHEIQYQQVVHST